MGTIIKFKFPDGREQSGVNVVTAYHEVNGTDYMITDTEKVDNGNKVVGVSFKPAGEDRFRNIIDKENWDRAKKHLVDDINDKKDDFEYMVLGEEVQVTEDYAKDLAVRTGNLDKVIFNYEEFLKKRNANNGNIQAPADIIEFPNQSVAPRVLESVVPESAPSVTPTPIPVENPTIQPIGTPEPIVVPSEPSPTIAPSPAPVIDNNIVEFPTAQNMNVVMDNPQPIVASEPVVTPVISEEPVNNGVFASTPSMSVQNNVQAESQVGVQASDSSVAKYYEELINSIKNEVNEIVKNMEEVNAEYKKLNDKVLSMNENLLNTCKKLSGAAEESGEKLVNACKEIDLRNGLSVQRFDQSQQILAFQNSDEMTRDLTKVA